MQLQQRDIFALTELGNHFLMTAKQVRSLCYHTDATGRVTRRRLGLMAKENLIRKRRMLVVNPRDGSASPVYHLASKGRELLAAHYDDEQLLLKPIEPSQPQHLWHYIAVTDFQIRLRHSLSQNNEPVTLARWVSEDEPIRLNEDGKKEFLYRKFGSTICRPDGAFLLNYRDATAVFYLEQDRDTYFHDRVAARKSPGFQEFSDRNVHRIQFPESNLDFFFVLFVVPTDKRGEQLRKAFKKRLGNHPVHKNFRFLSLEKLREDFLFESLLTCCHHEKKVPMIKRLETPSTQPVS